MKLHFVRGNGGTNGAKQERSSRWQVFDHLAPFVRDLRISHGKPRASGAFVQIGVIASSLDIAALDLRKALTVRSSLTARWP
jgi:hypothetical protein